MDTLLFNLPAAGAAVRHASANEIDPALLDALWRQARTASGPSVAGIAKVIEDLFAVRQSCSNWKRSVRESIQPHPITEWLRKCPLTHRTASKPRGYAGDAVMIDMIYGTGDLSPPTSPDARAIFSYTSTSLPCKAVRYRRYRLADFIDRAALDAVHQGRNSIRVMSVAAGHAREMLLSNAFQYGLVSEFVALDQDAQSLQELEQSLQGYGATITPVASSIRPLIAANNPFGEFDVIYSAGLYDYLDTRVARRLTARLFGMLKPGGRLLYANFAADITSAGYMEAIMDWWLTLRSEQDTLDLAADIPKNEIAMINTYSDPDGQIHFVEARRA